MKETPKLVSDTRAEVLMIGSLMASRQAIYEVEPFLNDSCFYDAKCRALWKAIKRLSGEGKETDLMAIFLYFQQNPSPEVSPEAIAVVSQNVQVAGLSELAIHLQELAQRRSLWCIGHKLVSAGLSETGDSVDELKAMVKNSLDDLFSTKRNVITLNDAFDRLNEQIRDNINNDEIQGTITGFDFLDRKGGLHGADLAIVAGETSMGKTSFAIAITMNAVMSGAGVAFYSMEMSASQLAARITAMYSGVSASTLLFNARQLSSDDFAKIYTAQSGANGGRLFIDEKSKSKLDSIIVSIRSLVAREGIRGAVVDYLQIVDLGHGGRISKAEALEDACRKLKNLAKDLDIWIIALSQLNRPSDNDHVPTLDRLKGSGGIAEASDYVMFVYRPERWPNTPFYGPFASEDVHNKAMIDVQKGRNTGVGSFLCYFQPKTTLFTYYKDETTAYSGPTYVQSDTSRHQKLPF